MYEDRKAEKRKQRKKFSSLEKRLPDPTSIYHFTSYWVSI
jgi:hypothetical protein